CSRCILIKRPSSVLRSPSPRNWHGMDRRAADPDIYLLAAVSRKQEMTASARPPGVPGKTYKSYEEAVEAEDAREELVRMLRETIAKLEVKIERERRNPLHRLWRRFVYGD